jgi:hypothetical protein
MSLPQLFANRDGAMIVLLFHLWICSLNSCMLSRYQSVTNKKVNSRSISNAAHGIHFSHVNITFSSAQSIPFHESSIYISTQISEPNQSTMTTKH